MKNKLVALMAFAAVVAVVLGVGAAGARSDGGRQLAGVFCTNVNALPAVGACIQLSYDGQTAQGYTDSPNRDLTLRPGTYWLTVTDNSSKHNFSLESPDGTDQDLTGVLDTPGSVTVKVNLRPGKWVLFCDADDHRQDGMYIDIAVGGVGQVGG
jgi:hypothetical protein